VSAPAGAATAQADRRPGVNPWLVAVVVTSAAFMEILDTTIVNVALPHIAGSLSASSDQATWCITSYLVANGIVLPVSGWLSSIFGRKRYFLGCILGFTVCSFLCGLATSLPELIIFRVMQGICGGGLQPSQQAIILDTFPPEKRGQAFSLTAVATVVAPVLGPTLGGWITDTYSWRWIFLINVPVGLLAWFLVNLLVREKPQEGARDRGQMLRIDYIGIGLIALGFGCLQVMMDKGEDYDWFASDFIRIFAVLAALGLGGAVIWLLNTKNPVVDLRVFANRNFAMGNLMIFIFAGLLYCSAVLIPQLVQLQFGYTALLSGLVISPGAVITIIALPIVGMLMNRVSARTLMMVGFAWLSVSFFYSSLLTPQIDYDTLVLMRVAQSVGIALLFAPISTSATGTLRPEQNVAGASLFTMSRNVGGSIGISLATATVANRTLVHQAYLSQHLSALSQPFADLLARGTATLESLGRGAADAQSQATGLIYRTLLAQASVMGYADVYVYCGIAAALVVPLGFLVKPVVKKKGATAGAGH